MKRILPLLIACMALTACAGGANAAPETTGADEITSVSEPVAETPGTSDKTTAETTAAPQVAAMTSAYSITTDLCNGANAVKRSLLETLSELKSMTPDDVAEKASATIDYDFEEYYNEAYINTGINEMTELLFPIAKIDGYTMISAKISGIRSVIYYYGPTEKVESEEGYLFDDSDGIFIGIKHPDDVDQDDPLAIPIRQTWGKNYILSDNMLHVVGSNTITVAVQNTIFILSVPDSMTDADTLFDLAARIRDSMELVKLDKKDEKQVAGCVLVSIFEVENLAGKDALKADILSMLKELERFRNLSEDTVMTMMHSTDESLSYEYMIYDSYVQQNIESLENFCFPTADIEGFALSYAKVTGESILYFYAPSDELTSDDFIYYYNNCIIIGINRDSFGDNDPLDGIRSGNRDREYTERDGMIFTPSYNEVDVRLNKTRFKLMTPKSITTDADTLFDLAARIRDSMELVTLD